MSNLQRDWYVVYSKPHKEEQARFHLKLKGVESFFPRLRLPAAINSKKRIVPLFPNYLFVRIHLPTESHYVVWSPGVKRIVSFTDTPVPIDERVVNFLKQEADRDGILQARCQLKRGQEVQISGGPFSGLAGIVQDPPDARGRVKILLKLLSRQISVEMNVELIDGDWVAVAPPAAAKIGSGSLSVAS